MGSQASHIVQTEALILFKHTVCKWVHAASESSGCVDAMNFNRLSYTRGSEVSIPMKHSRVVNTIPSFAAMAAFLEPLWHVAITSCCCCCRGSAAASIVFDAGPTATVGSITVGATDHLPVFARIVRPVVRRPAKQVVLRLNAQPKDFRLKNGEQTAELEAYQDALSQLGAAYTSTITALQQQASAGATSATSAVQQAHEQLLAAPVLATRGSGLASPCRGGLGNSQML
jgi:hypothetical protein